eukprot:scaffold2549_cov177-Ochromonas_danica.AAC.10
MDYLQYMSQCHQRQDLPQELLCCYLLTIEGFSGKSPPIRVAISGAGSSVGLQLLKRKHFLPVGIVKDEKEAKILRQLGGVQEEQVRLCDITQKDSVSQALSGCKKVVICSTAIPKRKLSYTIKNSVRWLVGQSRPPRPSELTYPTGYGPYEVDYLGGKNLIDASVKVGVEQIVLLSFMGGYRGSKLNEIGRAASDDIKQGNLIKWKRAVERYLMKRSFFTILHAGHLVDSSEFGNSPTEVVWDVDDNLIRSGLRRLTREDAAEAIVQALHWKESINRSIDIASEEAPKGSTKQDWLHFWALPGNCIFPGDREDDSLFH